ncbi:MAG: cupin domain-containing protein [Luteitalea sp.]|nr:cupin domain-containing protein [Luteitalea sp.]
MVSYFVALVFALQQPAAPAAPRRAPAPKTATVIVQVTDRTGTPIAGAQVIAEGTSRREGTTDPEGMLTLRTMTAGTYRVRAEGEGFIAFEREVVVRNAPVPTVQLALSPAPPPPVAPPPPPPAPEPVAPAVPTVEAGAARTLSIPDLAERSLGGRDAVRTVSIGCSGISRTELLVVRETHTSGVRPDEDEMLYLVAGEATMKLGDQEQPVTPGWFSIVPRGTPRSVTRRGRNPAIFLSTVSGQPCGSDSDR